METKSGSYPPGLSPQVQTSSHKWLLQNPEVLSSETLNLSYKPIHPDDIEELKLLELELFPNPYSDSFYRNIGNEIISLGCFLSHPCYNLGEIPMLVGVILFRIEMDYRFSYSRYSSQKDMRSCTYIMSIGVISILRGRGIGKYFLNYCLDYTRASKPTPSYIYLHVAVYNSEAIPFYKSFGFKFSEVVSNYYYSNNQFFDAYLYIYKLPKTLKPGLAPIKPKSSSSKLKSLCDCFTNLKLC